MNGDECGKTDGLRGDNASGRNKADRALGRYDTGNDNYCFSDGRENIPGHVCAVPFYPLTRFGRVQEKTRCMMCVTVRPFWKQSAYGADGALRLARQAR